MSFTMESTYMKLDSLFMDSVDICYENVVNGFALGGNGAPYIFQFTNWSRDK